MSDTNHDTSPGKNYFLEHDQDGVKEVDSETLGNPTPPPNVDLDKLRGDRIGDTVYSGKWCIQTVMKLMQSNVVMKTEATAGIEEKAVVVDMEEELQNEVGSLWDMTINVDVCMYLHSVGAVESICHIITNSQCPRATEMCVGMLANIITHSELWKILCGESAIFNILIQLLTNTDQPVLLEVARFFNTALCHTDKVQCYACLCENSPLVTQELMRILSGSTNADLLKQAAGLAYSLMSLDEDACFCSLFADVDFVSSIVEASKELGYQQETCGQNNVMELLHYFTTYDAGAVAIENFMEQIAEASTHYLKILCHSLNLSNNINIITTIIATLNHIFCRNMMVRLGLMASPSFIHSVLKTLVAVYRKLGFYNSIAYPKSQSKVHSSQIFSTWKMEEDMPAQTKTTDTSSWSERANVAMSASTAFRTPDASPSRAQQNNELEVSWSERRISSPLDDDFAEQKWKRPKEQKRLKRKEGARDGDKYDSESNVCVIDLSMSVSEKEVQGGTADSERDTGKDSSTESSLAPDEQSDRLGLKDSLDDDSCALKIQHGDRFNDPDSLRTSGEFTPQGLFEEMDSDNRGFEEAIEYGSSKYDGKEDVTGKHSLKASKSNDESVVAAAFVEDTRDKNKSHGTLTDNTIHDTTSQIALDNVCLKDDINVMSSAVKESLTKAEDDWVQDDSSKFSDHGFDDIDDEHTTESSDGINGDKYHKLLAVITEFLTDYFNNLRETLTRDNGIPCIKDVMVYFNTQCSSVEIRAIAKCVGTGTKITQPLGRLLHMCDHFKAKHMKSLLTDFIKRDT